MSDYHDEHDIGEKIVEMCDRVKVMHAAIPGAQAKWVIEVDDIRYKVVITVDDPAPAANVGAAGLGQQAPRGAA